MTFQQLGKVFKPIDFLFYRSYSFILSLLLFLIILNNYLAILSNLNLRTARYHDQLAALAWNWPPIAFLISFDYLIALI